MLLWLEFRAYLGSPRRSTQHSALVAGPRVSCTFSAEVAVKPEENAVFEKAQIEVPVGTGD